MLKNLLHNCLLCSPQDKVLDSSYTLESKMCMKNKRINKSMYPLCYRFLRWGCLAGLPWPAGWVGWSEPNMFASFRWSSDTTSTWEWRYLAAQEVKNASLAQSFIVLVNCDLTNSVMWCVDLPVTPSVPTSPSSGPKVPVQRCGSGHFACALSKECVSVSVLCDGRPDCKDHSDEINCGEGSTHWFIHEYNFNQNKSKWIILSFSLLDPIDYEEEVENEWMDDWISW